MPKFVSGSSGHIYSYNKGQADEDDDDDGALKNNPKTSSSSHKPSAVNKKGSKEQHKTSLDLFKEELRRLNEERDQQRNKLKNSQPSDQDTIASKPSHNDHQQSSLQTKTQRQQVCVPLKPDPRCPTTLTLQVNLNPKEKDSTTAGSFDTGDPATTNLYLGNLNPSVNENDLCDIFGKFGPLASIKVMWPRTDEERARNRNSGFVAYMSRIDSERAMRTLDGMEIRGYDLRLGWGKAVPLPQKPVYIPPELVRLLEPPPYTGLPFNAQLDEYDLRRKYKVPNPLPRQIQTSTKESQRESNLEFEEMRQVLSRATVRVVIPQDRSLLDRIHKMIEFVLRDGPVFEAIIIARERQNPDYKFLYDNRCHEHVYYRWKLYSITHGDDPYKWRTDEFRMFDGGPIWKPPPLNPFADGMPVELVEKSTGVNRELLTKGNSSVVHSKTSSDCLDIRSTVRLHLNLSDTRQKGSLGKIKRPQLESMLKSLLPTRTCIGSAMMFCINHSDAAQEVIDCIVDEIYQGGINLARKVALIFLISDVLHNCSAAVTNASYYRKGFQDRLVSIFENLRQYVIELTTGDGPGPTTVEGASNLVDPYRQKCDNFKQKILSVLGAWREWTLYEDEFIIRLSNILLAISTSNKDHLTDKDKQPHEQQQQHQDQSTTFNPIPGFPVPMTQSTMSSNAAGHCEPNESLDGELLDEETLIECLERKGLSLRWYKTLELSDDEEDQNKSDETERGNSADGTPLISGCSASSGDKQRNNAPIKFKTSKWETVDPDEVAEQVVRLSKWEAIEAKRRQEELVAKANRSESPNQPSGSSTSFEGEDDSEAESERTRKRLKRLSEPNSRSTSSSSPD